MLLLSSADFSCRLIVRVTLNPFIFTHWRTEKQIFTCNRNTEYRINRGKLKKKKKKHETCLRWNGRNWRGRRGETEAWRIVYEVTVPSSLKAEKVGQISILHVEMSTCPRSQEESPPKIYSKIKMKTKISLKSMKKKTDMWKEKFQIFAAWVWRSVPSSSVWQLMCVLTSTVLT